MVQDHQDQFEGEFPDKITVMFSGGIDSSTLLYLLYEECDRVRGVTINYGQRAFRGSIAAINRISVELNTPIEVVDVPQLSDSYAGFIEDTHNGYRIMQTEGVGDKPDPVPGIPQPKFPGVPRPSVFESCASTALAGVYAYKIGFDGIAEGVNKDDLDQYPERQRIHNSITDLMSTDGTEFRVFAPFVEMSRVEIMELAQELEVPLGVTWSCWENDVLHCGTCQGCKSRQQRFKKADLEDPTDYMTEKNSEKSAR